MQPIVEEGGQVVVDAGVAGSSPVLIDFFAGCGGTSEGFRQAGIEPVAAIDFDPEAARTYARNFPGAALLVQNIAEVADEALDEIVRHAKDLGRPIVFSACAPCQPFSKQRRGPAEADDRIGLLAEVLRFVRRHRPDTIFLENVPGLETKAFEYGPFRRVVRSLRRAGYHVSYRTIEARSFGVAQKRARLVVLASRHGRVAFPSATHGPGLAGYRTVREAIASLPPLAAGETHPVINAHQAARLSSLNLIRIAATPEGGDRRDWPDELVLDCHRDRGRSFTDTYGRLRWDDPAPALTTRCISYSNGRFGHPAQDRALTPREAAAIQSFPSQFGFEGTLTSMARQVGNAVPPTLAQSFARAILSHLRTLKRPEAAA